MTEFVPAAQPKARLSFEDRLHIIQTVNALPPQQFDELVFALDPPKGIIPPESAAQGSRSKALLDWVEGPTGPGLAVIDKYLQQIIPKVTKTAARLTAFAISGKLGDLSTAEIEAIVQLLRKKTGDDSIDLAFYEEGSIKLVLSGSAEGLEKLQELFETGELASALEDVGIEYAQPIERNTTAARKTRLIQTLRLLNFGPDPDLTLNSKLIGISGLVRVHISKRASVFARARARVLASELARNLASSTHTSNLDPAVSRAVSLLSAIANGAITLDHSYTADFAGRILSDLNRTLSHTLAGETGTVRSSELFGELTHTLILALAEGDAGTINNVIDLSGVDLSGANLKGINLTGVSLAGTNLTYAIVEEAIFGDNPGLSETAKDDLRRRGAIIQDTPGSNTPALVGR